MRVISKIPILAVLLWASVAFGASRFWVGGAGDWTDTAHWSLTSGGSGGASVPDATTPCKIDDNSGSPPYTINASVVSATNCLDFDMSGLTSGTVTITPPSGADMRVAGSLVEDSDIDASGVHFTMVGSGNITGSGTSGSSARIDIDSVGGNIALGANFTQTAPMEVRMTNGDFNLNDFNLTVNDIENGIGGSGTFEMTTSTVTTDKYFMGNGGTSTIVVNQGTSNLVMLAGIVLGPHFTPLYDVHIVGTTGGGLIVGNLLVTHVLTLDPGTTVALGTIRSNTVVCTGTSGNPIIITTSDPDDSSFTITNQPVCDWIEVDHTICDGAVPCIAGSNSVDNGNNTNWVFADAPVPTFTPTETPTETPTPAQICCKMGPPATPNCTPDPAGVTCIDTTVIGITSAADCQAIADVLLCGQQVIGFNMTTQCDPIGDVTGLCDAPTFTPTVPATPTDTPTPGSGAATPTRTCPQPIETTTTQSSRYLNVGAVPVIVGEKCGRRAMTIETTNNTVQCGTVQWAPSTWMSLEGGSPFMIDEDHNGNFAGERDIGCIADGSAGVYVTEFGVFQFTPTPSPTP